MTLRRECAWVAFFKGLMHAGDARCCAENEHWIPAAVSLYYAVFDLTVAALLATGSNPVVRFQNQWLRLDEAIEHGAEDPFRLITHAQACEFAPPEMEPDGAISLEELRQLREFASYRPSMRIQENGATFVNVCEVSASQFIRMIRQEVGQLETRFRLFRDYLYGQERADPGRPTPSEVACWLIEANADDAIRELGRYRSERAIEIAREIHRAAFLQPQPPD